MALYNHHRPHRALGGATPAERWAATPAAGPGKPVPRPPRAGLYKVTGTAIDWHGFQIGVGMEHAGERLLVIARDLDVAVFGPTGLIRRLTVDPSRRYQPTGKPPGRRRKTAGPCA